MKRIAIPVTNGELSEYFGKCSHYLVFDIMGKRINENELQVPGFEDVGRMPQWAMENGITDIITYKLDKKIIMLFSQYKINLFVGISRNTPGQLIEDFMNGKLVSDQDIIKEIIDSK